MVNHIDEARKHIDGAHEQQSEDGRLDESVLHNATLAVAEATLALVDEQRTANLIAYVRLLEAQYAEAALHSDEFDWDTRAASIERHTAALQRIREGLRL